MRSVYFREEQYPDQIDSQEYSATSWTHVFFIGMSWILPTCSVMSTGRKLLSHSLRQRLQRVLLDTVYV